MTKFDLTHDEGSALKQKYPKNEEPSPGFSNSLDFKPVRDGHPVPQIGEGLAGDDRSDKSGGTDKEFLKK